MRRPLILLALALGLVMAGCGKKEDTALDTAAPPPGPNADPDPPAVKKNIPRPPGPPGQAGG